MKANKQQATLQMTFTYALNYPSIVLLTAYN